jgi:UTP:GlnB (protein PII) uridylyltransferase
MLLRVAGQQMNYTAPYFLIIMPHPRAVIIIVALMNDDIVVVDSARRPWSRMQRSRRHIHKTMTTNADVRRLLFVILRPTEQGNGARRGHKTNSRAVGLTSRVARRGSWPA